MDKEDFYRRVKAMCDYMDSPWLDLWREDVSLFFERVYRLRRKVESNWDKPLTKDMEDELVDLERSKPRIAFPYGR